MNILGIRIGKDIQPKPSTELSIISNEITALLKANPDLINRMAEGKANKRSQPRKKRQGEGGSTSF